jgi:LacI family transcriptional regulator
LLFLRQSVRTDATILLLLTPDITYMRGISLGVMDFAHSERAWEVKPAAANAESMVLLRQRGINGIVTALGPAADPAVVEAVRRSGLPVVNVSGQFLPEAEPTFLRRVGPDDPATGALAADHLLGRGYRSFAFFGHRVFGYSVRREAGFVARLAAEGLTPVLFYKDYIAELPESQRHRPGPDDAISDFLSKLPRPVGIYCANDLRGAEVLRTCNAMRIRVPEDVAVVGTDDDELLCRLSTPPLTSIRLPLERIGFEAARLLERLMSGDTHAPREVLLPPIGVIERASTDSVAVDDALVSQAMEVIRRRSSRGASVQQVADSLAVSRRALERRIRKAVGQTPHALLRSRQIELAKQLLVTTDTPMADIATRAGFSSNSWMSVVFKQEVGMTPTQYRRRYSSG